MGFGEDAGFIRLSTEEVREKLEEAIARVVFDGSRIILHQAGEEVAALIPVWEFEKLNYLLEELIPSPFNPDEEEYYEDEGGIHCLPPDEVQAEFDLILEQVKEYGELFGLLPPEILRGQQMDIFIPEAILMPMDKFWLPEHLMHESVRN
ncbi:type II toxin-antitoxin system Phd/YefM family antitoxin [Microseira sp. BLCC-F43]|jgi:PHD/YefM family antitoxin component YafN of YafNO toxin-antitoxin module|uniref:type II toxin-antitoxin system Phd/YefM family antitoxin n=1 Tax=Microseira sp. BLCC-F43 TaxID=3153602 RepID=UPI0035BAC0BD